MSEKRALVGGAFVLETAEPEQIFTPEEFSTDEILMVRSVEEFMRREVLPAQARIEAVEEGLMSRLVRQAGGLGLLGAGVPERYGGLDLPKSTLLRLAETTALNLPFAISVGVHAGVGVLPLLLFGTADQKQRYLPTLASGEKIGAFALSEANSGSDALGARTKAVLDSKVENYVLNGSKMWITNGGFADLFTVFAKADADKFTAFLVERDTTGLMIDREEHKLGLHGSSTRRILLDDARVPVQNLLGEVGMGHRPALCALNLGRLTISAMALGAAKEWIKLSAAYAQQRVQFGQPIARFGLIQHKLAEMATRLFVLESLVYRTGGYLDARFAGLDADAVDAGESYRAASEEYAIECAIAKFTGTETMGYVADEGLQIHGGFGYSEEFPMARAYRDARVFRIFEGTNEINRLTVIDQFLRRVVRGRLELPAYEATRLDERMQDLIQQGEPADALAALASHVERMRLTILACLSQAYASFGRQLTQQEEVAAELADMIALLYGLESAWLRCCKLKQTTTPESFDLAVAAAQVYAKDACAQIAHRTQTVLLSLDGGDEVRSLSALLRFDAPPYNTIALRRHIAAQVLEREGYCW